MRKLENGMFVTPPTKKSINNEEAFTFKKQYKVKLVSISSSPHYFSFWITTNDGKDAFCLLNRCAHISNNDWKIVKQP